MVGNRLSRTRTELSEFLKQKRNSLSPMSIGLPQTRRRRTPGLRREEVATMAGIGLTWYTWLEQGRSITVSSFFLDRIASVLQLDEVERRHLFLLAQERPPICHGQTSTEISGMARLLLDDLIIRPAFVFNLRWDVIAWNASAQLVFDFESQPSSERNMFWMLFADNQLSKKIIDWDKQAPLFVASFRRDLAQAPEDEAMLELVDALEQTGSFFKELWHRQDVTGRCQGKRKIIVDGIGSLEFNHSTVIIDSEQHLRMALYAVTDGQPGVELFERACCPA